MTKVSTAAAVEIEEWIKGRRDEAKSWPAAYPSETLDQLLDDFRDHMVTGTPLSEVVHRCTCTLWTASIPPMPDSDGTCPRHPERGIWDGDTVQGWSR